ncbi:hypothetical protein A2U01_0086478, partial [Trifolium medium]|nr:hypothetical protein [Trifolium medium]
LKPPSRAAADGALLSSPNFGNSPASHVGFEEFVFAGLA